MSIIKEEKRVKGKQSKYVNSLVKEFDKAVSDLKMREDIPSSLLET